MPERDEDVPIEATVAAMDAADVGFGLLSAWRGPNGLDLVSNDEVAAWVAKHPNRFAGLATVDLAAPMAVRNRQAHPVHRRGGTGLP